LVPETENRTALPHGYQLNDYCIEHVLGHGGFGITYLARDQRLDRLVAIKEFMPADLATREAGSTVVARSGGAKADYEWGLKRFLAEARTLAHFHHPNIVEVLRLFEANNTAYIVMCFEDGQSLDVHLKSRGGTIPASELLALTEPLLNGLEAVHREGFLHRDIKPSNIFLRADGRPILLDFGTARLSVGNMSRSVASVLTPGFAPIEQYTTEGRQGPFTDIYGLGAVLYTCIVGHPPPEAPTRIEAYAAKEPDPIKPAVATGRGWYPEAVLVTVDRCLALLAKNRPQSIAEVRKMILPDGSGPSARAAADARQAPGADAVRWRGVARHWPSLAAGCAAVLLVAVALRAGIAPPVEPTGKADVAGIVTKSEIPEVGNRISGEIPELKSSSVADESALHIAREALQLSAVYGRQSYRRHRQQEAIPSLERLARTNTSYQKQLEDVRLGLQRLDGEIESLLKQYYSLVDELAKRPESFARAKQKLLETDMPPAGELARQFLINHVEDRQRGTADVAVWRTKLDEAYSSTTLW
jgi:serine/threonine protein kinase